MCNFSSGSVRAYVFQQLLQPWSAAVDSCYVRIPLVQRYFSLLRVKETIFIDENSLC
jgi:hypothetical protein